MEENKVSYKKAFICSIMFSIVLSSCISYVLLTTYSVPEHSAKCNERRFP